MGGGLSVAHGEGEGSELVNGRRVGEGGVEVGGSVLH